MRRKAIAGKVTLPGLKTPGGLIGWSVSLALVVACGVIAPSDATGFPTKDAPISLSSTAQRIEPTSGPRIQPIVATLPLSKPSPTPTPTATSTPVSTSTPIPSPTATPSPVEQSEKHLNAGLSLLEEERLDEAIGAFTEAIRLNPENSRAYTGRGRANAALSQLRPAIDDFSQAIRIDPQFANLYRFRGMAYGLLGQHSHGLLDLDEAISRDPQSAESYFQRGVAYLAESTRAFSLRQLNLAVQDTSKAILLDPNHGDAYQVRALAYMSLGDLHQAQQDAQYAATLDSKGAVDTVALILERMNAEMAAKRLGDFIGFTRACYSDPQTLAGFSRGDQDAFRRAILQVFGSTSSSSAGQRANLSAFCTFKAQEPITNFFADEDVQTAFVRFLTSPPQTRSSMEAIINRILEERSADPLGPAAAHFQVVFSTPQQAVSAAMQLWLVSAAPRSRSRMQVNIANDWADRFAIHPEEYQTPDQIAAIFEGFKR